VTGYALKAPPGGWKVPGWATPHNLALIAGVTAAAVVIIMLARAVGRLAGAVRTAAAPAPSLKPSGRGPAFLAAAAAAIGGLLLWKRHGTAAAGTAAAPQPRPTVTVTAPPHPALPPFAWPHLALHLTGTQWTVIVVVALVLTYAAIRPLLKRSGS
jgi:hypothetical protein